MVIRGGLKNFKRYFTEVTRGEIIKAAKIDSADRFEKKDNYKAQDFDNVHFDELFETDTFTWSSRVGDYIVTISFEGAFENLQFALKSMRGKNRIDRITVKMLTEALSKALDDEDLYVDCTCPDFKYRFAYWATQADCKYGQPQTHAPKSAKTNADNKKGYVCKHILAVLYGKRWVNAAAKCWYEYIQANPEVASEYIWG